MKKLILLLFIPLVFACGNDEGNLCLYQPTLTTLEATEINDFNVTLNGVVSIVSENCDNPNNTEQGFVYSTSIQPTINDNKVNINGTEISTIIENLDPNTTYYARVFLTNAFGDFYGNEVSFTTSDSNPVYLAENGVTVKAKDWAEVGMSGGINGVTYTIVDRPMLEEMIANDEDITKICTSKITNMEDLLHTGSFNEPSTFNQDIGSWDVSNVTNMKRMFVWCGDFNQNISYWNVGSVTNMEAMFVGAMSFNQPIGGWDMSSVENIRAMFNVSYSFNQPIGNWDVSNVSDLTYLFQAAYSFNQDISSWDVSNVIKMNNMFNGCESFNQDISSWDVSNVTSMESMFWEAISFNQDISSWDVSSVTNMSSTFHTANSFNQDLSSWDVDNVTIYCGGFCYGADSWTLPKPNFTNCSYDLGCN